jgi:hypothetical protein
VGSAITLAPHRRRHSPATSTFDYIITVDMASYTSTTIDGCLLHLSPFLFLSPSDI